METDYSPRKTQPPKTIPDFESWLRSESNGLEEQILAMETELRYLREKRKALNNAKSMVLHYKHGQNP